MDIQRRPEAGTDTDAAWARWIQEISRGDEVSLRNLYSASVSHVYGLALRITRHPAVAEEVVEEVFFQVWRISASFDLQRGRPLTWLLVICRSIALKKLRDREDGIAFEDIDSIGELSGEEAFEPQSLLLATEQNTLLHNALKSLGPLERQLLALAFFQGLTYSEVARHMAMPLGAVKSNMRRVLQLLRKRLDGMNEGRLL